MGSFSCGAPSSRQSFWAFLPLRERSCCFVRSKALWALPVVVVPPDLDAAEVPTPRVPYAVPQPLVGSSRSKAIVSSYAMREHEGLASMASDRIRLTSRTREGSDASAERQPPLVDQPNRARPQGALPNASAAK
jgi:hypothetical protein